MRNAFAVCILLWLIAVSAFPRRDQGAHRFLGTGKNVPYSVIGDPAGALPGEKQLRVRPLLVDDKVGNGPRENRTPITDRSFVVRRALRLNDALPGDKSRALDMAAWTVADGRSRERQRHCTASAGL